MTDAWLGGFGAVSLLPDPGTRFGDIRAGRADHASRALGHSLINPAGSTSPDLTRSATAVRLSTGVRESFE
jgi:hypothetical protein